LSFKKRSLRFKCIEERIHVLAWQEFRFDGAGAALLGELLCTEERGGNERFALPLLDGAGRAQPFMEMPGGRREEFSPRGWSWTQTWMGFVSI
jgi:hypothetical protein